MTFNWQIAHLLKISTALSFELHPKYPNYVQIAIFFILVFQNHSSLFFIILFFLNYSIKNMYMNCLSISATLIFYVCVCLRFTQSQHFTTKNIVVSLDWKNWLHRNNDRKKTKISFNQIAGWIVIYLR